jgi:transposase
MRNDIERYRHLCAQGLNAQQIARRLKVKKNTVYQNCKRHGIALPSVVAGKGDSSWRRA